MYIRNYQIHNVLDAYRKQLSRGAGAVRNGSAARANPSDAACRPDTSARQTIIDRVSAEIIQRIMQDEPVGSFKATLSDEYAKTNGSQGNPRKEVQFTYTVIDEQNRKLTNSMPIERISPLPVGLETDARTADDPVAGTENGTGF